MFRPSGENYCIMQNPTEGQRVLDLACGTGIVTVLLADAVGSAGAVVGLDINAPMLDVARSKDISGPSIEWSEASAMSIPYPDDSFDMVLCQQGFQFFSDHLTGAREALRVLKPGGRLAFSVWADTAHHTLLPGIFRSIADRIGVPVETTTIPFSFGDDPYIESLLQDAGFRDITVVTETHEAVCDGADRWIRLCIMAAAAPIPAFGELSEEQRAALVSEVTEDISELFREHVRGSSVVMMRKARTALATK